MVTPITPQGIGEGLGGFFNTKGLAVVIQWTGYIFISAIILAVLVVFYFIMQYKYKISYPILHYNADKTTAQIVGFKKDRARDVKKGGITKQSLFKLRKTIQKFNDQDIRPGNKVYILRVNDDGTYVPMPHIVFQGGINSFQQISSEENYWAMTQLKENARTFQNEDATKRAMVLTIITVVCCLLAVGVTVYFILKAPNRVVESFDKWGGQFIQVANKIGGTPPPG